MSDATTSKWDRENRDLIIELMTEMRQVREGMVAIRSDIKDINSGLSNRVLNLESNSVSKVELDTLSAEVDSLKLWRSALAGAYALGLFLAGVAMWWLK